MSETITPRHRIEVYLGGEYFTSKTVVIKRVTAMLAQYEPGEVLNAHDKKFACDLLEKHPRAPFVIGCGIKSIVAYQPPPRHGRTPNKSLRIIRLDGTVALCGFKDVLLGRCSCKNDFVKAARSAVEQQLESFSRDAFKSHASQIWDAEAKTWIAYRAHRVEYLGRSLEQLIDKYLADTQLFLAGVRYYHDAHRQNIVHFADVDDRREWQNWHRKHAKLRIVKKIRSLQSVAYEDNI